ncbi:MAG: cysteine desulfurase-like protein [bacterium]|nr:cysteine desulfurase-like protein [bacterium]
MNLDNEYVRRQFPALAGDWTFFDNAGGSQTLTQVVQRIQEYLLTSDVQLGASYAVSRLAGERVASATEAMANWVNARHPSEIIMGSSTSMLLRILSICFGQTLEEGDEIIVTNLDHEANIGPWVDLAKTGITLKTWEVNPNSWELEVRDLDVLLTDRTRLVALTHASNIVGHIHPIRQIADIVHRRGAMVCVDGVAYAPHRRIDVQAFDVDFYAFSFYKVYGPHYALLYAKRDVLDQLPGINHFFLKDEVPYRFQPGSVNYELSYGMTGLWDYVSGLCAAHGRTDLMGDRPSQLDFVFDLISRHEEALVTPLLEFLTSKKNVRLIGRAEPDRLHRVPTVSFIVDDMPSDSITLEVDKHHIAIRYGDFYARRLIDSLGLGPQNGVVRASLVHYNRLEEVEQLISVLDHLI